MKVRDKNLPAIILTINRELKITKMKTFPFFYILAVSTFSFVACKKGDKNTPPDTSSHYRIRTTTEGSDKKTFSYDGINRLTRIDFDGGYYQITYSNTEINAQVFFANGNPDPSWKYRFAVNNNHIVGGFRYMPNGSIGRDYRFDYDNDGRLQLTTMGLYDFTGDISEKHRYGFVYDGGNNLQQVHYTKELKDGNTMKKTDSISTAISYYTNKNFIKWKQTGFDFFGKVTGGVQLTGLEIIPFSFLHQERIIPTEKAVQKIDLKKYAWLQGSNSWSNALSATQNIPETDYVYNDKGLPVKYKNVTIEWEAYE